MKKHSTSKELLIDWLRTALDFKLYPGMGWSDRHEEIFYVNWVHKSSESWSGDDLEPFRAWAAHKGKLDGKNPKQLKATFRCALNSKRELKEHHRSREKRYWQFVDPNTVEKNKIPKKKRKNNKANSSLVNNAIAIASVTDMKNTSSSGWSASQNSSGSEDEMSRPSKLPSFDSFQPLTPPDQANEPSYNQPDMNYSKEKFIKSEKFDSRMEDIDRTFSNISFSNVSNNLTETNYEACTLLPPFETFCSFRTITPPPQKNEVYFIQTEYSPNYTPPPEQNRLSPPQKYSHIPPNSFNRSSTDFWQPNCCSVPNEDEEKRNSSDFFSSAFIGLYKSSTQEHESNSYMDFITDAPMDQSVPVTNASINLQCYNKTVQSTPNNRIPSNTPMQTDPSLDFMLEDDVNPETWKKLLQEIANSSLASQNRLNS